MESMKRNIALLLTVSLLMPGCFTFAYAYCKPIIAVKGTVVDGMTGNGISSAMVTLFDAGTLDLESSSRNPRILGSSDQCDNGNVSYRVEYKYDDRIRVYNCVAPKKKKRSLRVIITAPGYFPETRLVGSNPVNGELNWLTLVQ
jgi:hypothetical protein